MPETTEKQIDSRLIDDVLMRGMIQFLETFFSTFPELTWDIDETKTRILIHDFDAFNLESVDKRPRIAVELVEGHWNNLIVDNLGALDPRKGTEETTDLVSATMTLHCVSKESLEAKSLKDIVFEAVRIFRRELRREMGVFNIDSLNWGREQRIRTSSQSEVRSVPVTVALQLQRRSLKILDEEKYQAFGP